MANRLAELSKNLHKEPSQSCTFVMYFTSAFVSVQARANRRQTQCRLIREELTSRFSLAATPFVLPIITEASSETKEHIISIEM